MKLSVKSVSIKTAVIAALSVLVGAGTTVGVFAAIPDSGTGVISACRATLGGALRVIDAQSGATCSLLESPVGLSSPSSVPPETSALLYLKPDPQNAYNFVADMSRSRNVVRVNTINDPDPANAAAGYRVLCIQLKFDPEVTMTTVDPSSVGVGVGSSLAMSMIHQSATVPAELNYYCGAGYNVITHLSPSSPAAVPQAVWFSK